MLSELATEEQLKEALERCKDFPDYLVLYQCIRHALERRDTSVTTRVLVHRDNSGTELHIVLRNTFNRISIILSCLPNAALNHAELDALFDYIHEMVKEWYDARYAITVYGIDAAVKKYFDWLRKRQAGMEVYDTPCSMFYMTKDQMDHVMATNVALPDGCSILKLDPDKHAAFISQKWKFAQADETKRTEAKLRHIPAFGVQHDDKGALTSFALIDAYGSLHHLYTMPEHRRKGLSKVVEVECGKSCIESGLVPYKFVEHSNSLALETSRRSSVWTEWTIEEGGSMKPVTVMFAGYRL